MNLVYLADPKFGGWVTFTAHLWRALTAVGVRPRLFKVAQRFEARQRDYGYGLSYQNVPLAALLPKARETLIVAASPKRAEEAERLVRAGAAIVIHDPTELTKETRAVLKATTRPVVVIRRVNGRTLDAMGVPNVFIPHPYVAAPVPAGPRPVAAVAVSRLDWDKNTHVIVEANLGLPHERRVQVWGAENTMYTHHRCAPVDPAWRDNYHGRFPATPTAVIDLASRAEYVVDLSVIKGDGDGTQYTFLEAWDAGAALVVHKDWVITGTDSVRPGDNALAVANAAELRDVLTTRPPDGLVEAGRRELLKHAPELVGRQYVEALLG